MSAELKCTCRNPEIPWHESGCPQAEAAKLISSGDLLECVELAIISNGGGAHKKEMCDCDPSVGKLCEYCAIWTALNRTFNHLLDLKGKHSNR